MAFTTTTLSSACALNDKSIKVASATGFAANSFVLVDQEIMKVTQDYTSGTTITVLRGQNGTAQVAHVVTANVTVGLGSDYAVPVAGGPAVTYATQRGTVIQSITATSSLTLPPAGSDLRVLLNGTSVITLTVPVPTKDMDGTRLTIIANGAAAHLLTFTGGLGGAGTSYDVVTLNGTAPCAMEAIAANGLWMPIFAPPMGGTVTNLIGSVA